LGENAKEVGAQRLFAALKEEGLRYLVVGGTAAVLYGVQRATFDIDIAIAPKKKDIEHFLSLLKRLGYNELIDINTEERIGKIGEVGVDEIKKRESVRAKNGQAVDILVVQHSNFNFMWEYRIETKYKGTTILLPNLLDLIHLKEHAGRPIDLEDAKKLRQILRTKKNK
jgi:hypothetical protein